MSNPEAVEPIVDVGIPTRGRPRFLAEAIESVLAQSFGSWRLVIQENDVGGGALERMVAPYLADARVHYRANGRDVGQARNHTLLVRGSDAPYVALLHDDDRWEADFLRRRVDLLEAHPEVGFVFSATTNIDESGRELSRSRHVLGSGVRASEEAVQLLLRYNCVGVTSRVLARRSAYEAVGDEFTERFAYHDWEMWMRLAARFPVGYLAVHDVAYRVHPEQTTFRVRVDRSDMLGLFDHLEEIARTELPRVALSRRVRRRRRSAVRVSQALDALEQGDRGQALVAVARALRTYPPSVVDPRVPVVLLALPFGARSGSMLARARRAALSATARRGASVRRR